MNTGETTIYINPATQPGVLAPITRIGGGEVRVERALASQTAAWAVPRLSRDARSTQATSPARASLLSKVNRSSMSKKSRRSSNAM